MEKDEKFQSFDKLRIDHEQSRMGQMEKIEGFGHLNKNCWLVKTLNYSPYKRCQYCELKFRNCLFLHYQIISLILIIFLLALSLLIAGGNLKLVIISVFTSVIVYGYFFNKSTDKIIQAYFAQRKAKEALEELTESLEEKVDEQTKKIKDAYNNEVKAKEKIEKISEDLRFANIELKQLDEAKSEFLSIASHQLRTPLTAIKGYLSMALDGKYGPINGEIKEKLNNVFQSNERMIKLVNDLLNISRIETGKIELELEKTDVKKIISGLIENFNISAKEKNIHLEYENPENPLPSITADSNKITEIISNIIDNAIHYTKKGGIKIRADAAGNQIRICIKDTGEGMTREELSDLFKSFSRGAAGTQFYSAGVGLGLYAAKKFVEMHKGKIWAESDGKNRGSAFHIELPV